MDTTNYKKCKFVSDGKWFDKNTEVKCISYWDVGIELQGRFKGLKNGKADVQICPFTEFKIIKPK